MQAQNNSVLIRFIYHVCKVYVRIAMFFTSMLQTSVTGSKKVSWRDYFRDKWDDMKNFRGDTENNQLNDDNNFRKVGQSTPVRTFKYNPKKFKKLSGGGK